MRNNEPRDPRSTWRKRARKILENVGRDYWCADCGRSPTNEDAPGGLWPGMETLQVDHENKDISDCDPANLQYRCASCHKERDSLTAPGISLIKDEWGYSLPGYEGG